MADVETITRYNVPLIIRGRVIEDREISHGGRRGGVSFTTPDLAKHLSALTLASPSDLADLYKISFDEILDYLVEFGERLDYATNPHLQEAFELSCQTSGLGPDILRGTYENLGRVFNRAEMREMAEALIGIPFLEGWVPIRKAPGYTIQVRAFGARSVHITAGNVPTVAAISLLRNVITRSDMIIKTPSNDPLTAVALARTMIDFAPNHPITRHISVAYWKGGDAQIEDALYLPKNIEKIVAWGGLASITHIAKYIRPGIDLITLDPKLSSTIIGKEAFADEAVMRSVAERLALDIGVYNQEGCLNARVVYAQTGTDAAGLAKANRLGELVYQAIQTLPSRLSGPAKQVNPDLAEEMEGLRYAGELYRKVGGDVKGGVIISQIDEPVEFAPLLANRIANIVPVDSIDTPIQAVTAYTQTIGIYPDSLIPEIRDRLAFHGAQRLVSLGYATRRVVAGPSDGIEPMRRMAKWIMHETYDPQVIEPIPEGRK
jgi:hypothetical protein